MDDDTIIYKRLLEGREHIILMTKPALPPGQLKKMVSLRLPQKVIARLAELSASSGLSQSKLVELALDLVDSRHYPAPMSID